MSLFPAKTPTRSFDRMQAMSGSLRMRGGTAPDPTRMADQLGITQEELQNELDTGKTFRDIAAEHGIDIPSERGLNTGTGSRPSNRFGSGAGVMAGSGAVSSFPEVLSSSLPTVP